MNRRELAEEKVAAIRQWSADPCGPSALAAPGSAEYFREIVAKRHDYAPWMEEELAYSTAEGLDILDVGCGQGIDLFKYASAGGRVSGVDLTPRHVELASAHLEAMDMSAQILKADAESLPFADEVFDRVSSNGVLHHTPDMPAALREIRRVLRPGGEAVIIVYNKSSIHYWLQQVLIHGVLCGQLIGERSMANVLSANVEESSIDARPLVDVYRPRDLEKLLSDSGFEQVQSQVRHFQPTDVFPYGLLAKVINRLSDPQLLDEIGRRVGWYVVGRGLKP